MIDSIWSLLAARYTDIDSWLDLKYLGTNLVETLTSFDQTQGPEKSEDLDTIANLKKGEEFKESDFKLEFNSTDCERYKILHYNGCPLKMRKDWN